jgi:hypothetical protein
LRFTACSQWPIIHPTPLLQASNLTLKILALGGDGIGPEVVDAALNLGKMARDLGGTLSTDAMTDAAIDPFRAL